MLKSDEVRFLWEIHFCPNLAKKGPKIGYFAFFENAVISFSKKGCKMKGLLILEFPSQTPCLAKFLFWSYCPKQIRLQDSLKCNISNKNWGIKLIFCLQINIRVSYKFFLLLWWAWSGIPKVPKDKHQTIV